MAIFLLGIAVMGELPAWTDWLTQSFFRVRVSKAAAKKLCRLHPEEQQNIKAVLDEVAETAASVSARLGGASYVGFSRPLLQLRFGRVTVRYAIDEDTRTLSVEHVIALARNPTDDLEGIG